MSEVLKAIINDLKAECRYQVAEDGFTRMMMNWNSMALFNRGFKQLEAGKVYDLPNYVAVAEFNKGAARKVLKTETVTVEDL